MRSEVPQSALKKALLLEEGWISLSQGVELPPLERATAGPEAGLRSLFVEFDGYRVRLAVGESSFSLVRRSDGFAVELSGSTFLEKVAVQTPPHHVPNQLFINLSTPCAFDCKFCATPKLGIGFALKPQKVAQVVEDALERHRIDAIALTCSVLGSERESVKLLSQVVKLLRREFGHSIPIGVEPYVTKPEYVDELYSVGADEIKINIETFDRWIFQAVCPHKSYERILAALEHAATVFGKNKVCSNVLIGLGENDYTTLSGLQNLAEMGVVANLRPLRIPLAREEELRAATCGRAHRPSAARILGLALRYKKILNRHGLRTYRFRTMCFRCTGCEIVPQQDV